MLRFGQAWRAIGLALVMAGGGTGCGCSNQPPAAPEDEQPATGGAADIERRVAMKVTVDDPDPYQRLIAEREQLRVESAGVIDRLVRRLPPGPASYFDRLRRVCGEPAVLRELIRWANDPANAAVLTDADRGELRRWEQGWRDWEGTLAEMAGGTPNDAGQGS
jgi:hypothetical protein